MKKSKYLAIILAGVLALSSTTSVMATPTYHKAQRVDAEQVLNLNILREPTNLDFQKASDSMDTTIYNWCMEGLTRCEGNYNIVPGIAEKWEVSPDGLTWTFHLRDAKWSDGKPVTAQDFVYGALRSIDPKAEVTNAYYLYDIVGAIEYKDGEYNENRVGIKAVDDKTVRFTLKYPVVYFDTVVSFPNFAPSRKDIVERDGENYNKEAANFVTDGPFVVSSWEHNVKMVFEKNKTYWNQSAIKLNTINGYMLDTSKLEQAMLDTNQLDMMLSYYNEENGKLVGAKREICNTGKIWYLNFNCQNKVFKNKNIRKALTLALNRKELIEGAEDFESMPALAFVNSEIIGDVGNTDFRSHKEAYFKDNDLKLAKEFLKKGLKELKLKDLPKIEIIYSKSSIYEYNAKTVAKMWKRNLGIDSKVLSVSYDERNDKVKKGNYQVVVSRWWPDMSDATQDLSMFKSSSSNNESAYKSKKYDELIDNADYELDIAKRSAYLHEAEDQLMADMPICPLYFEYYSYTTKDYVKNIKMGAFGPYINPIHAYIEGKIH